MKQPFLNFINSGSRFERFVARYRQPGVMKPTGILYSGSRKAEEVGISAAPHPLLEAGTVRPLSRKGGSASPTRDKDMNIEGSCTSSTSTLPSST